MQFTSSWGAGPVRTDPASRSRCATCPPHHAFGAALLVWALTALAALAPQRADAQTVGHWRITRTYSGTTTSLKNDQGGQAPWPANGPINAPTRDFGNGDQITVAMSGTITATLTWVDQNNNPITDPPPPADVYVLQRSSSGWSYGGEEIAANVTDEGVSTSLPNGQEASVTGPPNWSHSVTARKISKVNGSSGTISLPVDVDAHLTLTCTAGFSGSATAQVTYDVVEVAPADCYDFSGYPNPPPSGSTPCAQDAATKLAGPLADGSGYYTDGRAYTNQTAQHALEQLKKTAIFYVFGHGGDSTVSCQTFWAPGHQEDTSSGWGAIVQTVRDHDRLVQFGVPLSVPPIPPIPSKNIVVLSSVPSGSFSKVLLAVYEGCCTASYRSTNPTQGTRNLGATCVLGFTNHIGEAQARAWAGGFWTSLANGTTVASAASSACAGWALNDPIRQYSVLGSGMTVIDPARYGQ